MRVDVWIGAGVEAQLVFAYPVAAILGALNITYVDPVKFSAPWDMSKGTFGVCVVEVAIKRVAGGWPLQGQPMDLCDPLRTYALHGALLCSYLHPMVYRNTLKKLCSSLQGMHPAALYLHIKDH